MSKRKSLSQVFRQLLRSNAEEKKAEPIEESQEVPKASNGASPNLTKAPDLSRDIHKSTQHFASAELAADNVSLTRRSHTSLNGIVDNLANALLSPSTKSRSGPRRLLKESARLKEEEDAEQGAAYLAYKVLIVDNQTTHQKQFKFKVKSSSEVIVRLSLKHVTVYPRTSKSVPPITEIEYRALKAVTLKGGHNGKCLRTETYFASGIKIVAFEFEAGGEQCVTAYASHEAEAIIDKLKILIRKARYLGYI